MTLAPERLLYDITASGGRSINNAHVGHNILAEWFKVIIPAIKTTIISGVESPKMCSYRVVHSPDYGV